MLRFNVFEVDLRTGELRRHGLRVRLPSQSFQVLALLLEHPGELVSREELREKLWRADTFVDFDHGVNAAVNRLREALGDSADSPKFVETLSRRGYRFIVPVEWTSLDSEQPTAVSSAAAASCSEPSRDVQDISKMPSVSTPRRGLRMMRFAFGVTGVTLLTGVLLMFYLLRPRPHSQSDTLTVIPFTTYPGFETAPSFSPDGNQIAFAWSREGLNFDLYIKQIGQERAVQLTNRPAIFLIPAWSPDGRFIAFARRGKDDNDTGIYLLPVLGGSERKLADATPAGYWPLYLLSWSPDGKWLAFSKEDAAVAKGDDTSPLRTRIHLFNVETDEQRVLTDPSADCAPSLEPAFSPDGKYLASVCVVTAGVSKIYIQPSTGGRAREVALVNGAGGHGWPEGLAWARDSQSLLYSARLQIWRVLVGGGEPERLLFAHDARTPAVAQIGNRLAYTQVNYGNSAASIWRLDLTSPTKTVGPATKIISSSRGEWNPRLSPDGKHIAFESLRSGNLEIWMSDRDGSNPVQVSSFERTRGKPSWSPESRRPQWSPDSHRIVFSSNASGRAELYIVNSDGSQLRRLSTGTQNALAPFWSADGRWIYFESHWGGQAGNSQEPAAIWKVPVEGGAAMRLTKEGRYDPQESMDGTRVFYVVADRQGMERSDQIWSVPADGGDERLETPMATNASWAPAQHGIYFLDGVDVGLPRGRLRFFDFTTKRLQTLAELHSGVVFPEDMSVSRDGRTIFYSQMDLPAADINLVEGFR